MVKQKKDVPLSVARPKVRNIYLKHHQTVIDAMTLEVVIHRLEDII